MLQIYTNKEFLTEDNRRRVFPLLFDMVYSPNVKTLENFSFADSLEHADIAIFPIDVISFSKEGNEKYFKNWIDEVSKYNIEIWIYAAGDFGFSLNRENIKTFRFGGFHSKMNLNTYIMPAFVNDPYSQIIKNDFFALQKKAIPNIGFVGNANGSVIKLGKEFVLHLRRNFKNSESGRIEDYHSFYPSSYKRYSLLTKMIKNGKFECNFIFRNKYRAKEKNAGNRKDSTLEFFENIQNNLYVFCLRGTGNFSIRFYEALIMGRIPVLIDTDVRLPFADSINWKNHCLLASEKTFLKDLEDFHASKSEDELKAIQIDNRKLMLEKLNRVDYFVQFSKILKAK